MTTAGDVAAPLAAARERSRDQVARYHEIRAVLEKLRVTASSADRSVTVEMAAGGGIVDLRLSAQAMGKSPDMLASTILDAIRQGMAQVAQRTAAEVEPLTGRRVDVSALASGRMPSLGAAGEQAAAAPPPGASGRFVPDEE